MAKAKRVKFEFDERSLADVETLKEQGHFDMTDSSICSPALPVQRSLAAVRFRFTWPAKDWRTKYTDSVWIDDKGWTCDGEHFAATASEAIELYQWWHCGQRRKVTWIDPPTPNVRIEIEPDPMCDVDYLEFVEGQAEHCVCADRYRPCEGVLAGGMCDRMSDEDDHDDYV